MKRRPARSRSKTVGLALATATTWTAPGLSAAPVEVPRAAGLAQPGQPPGLAQSPGVQLDGETSLLITAGTALPASSPSEGDDAARGLRLPGGRNGFGLSAKTDFPQLAGQPQLDAGGVSRATTDPMDRGDTTTPPAPAPAEANGEAVTVAVKLATLFALALTGLALAHARSVRRRRGRSRRASDQRTRW